MCLSRAFLKNIAFFLKKLFTGVIGLPFSSIYPPPAGMPLSRRCTQPARRMCHKARFWAHEKAIKKKLENLLKKVLTIKKQLDIIEPSRNNLNHTKTGGKEQ
jgi:hypothetical protein